MAECGCGGVALEALALMCKALSRLEVGQIGVLKFGGPEGAVPLHGLATPFTDAAGPGIMANLRFKQDNTIADQPMLRLMEALDHMLDSARHQGGAGGIGAGTQCGCGGVALEALALMCKALSRLEVGQIGVLKFGGPEGAVPLHGLATPFTDAAGPGIMANLRFKQDNTIADQPMLRLMEALDNMLDSARHQGGAGGIGAGTQDLAQLVLIVADGRLHEKDGLRARVRELAAKRGVCLVFIAIDSPAVVAPASLLPPGAAGQAPSQAPGQPLQPAA
ncbi:VWFA domain-containing protein, partial [Haematococcus lacustris]